jgi:hypothetical protein
VSPGLPTPQKNSMTVSFVVVDFSFVMWQVCSGDILQFGVDVMENSRKVGDNLF